MPGFLYQYPTSLSCLTYPAATSAIPYIHNALGLREKEREPRSSVRKSMIYIKGHHSIGNETGSFVSNISNHIGVHTILP
jgi:hypothetical protein